MLENVLPFSIAVFLLAISPGPDNLFVLVQSITHGKKIGLAIVCGLISGCLVHTTLLAFGVSAIIKKSDTIFFILKVFGALYLFYLAFKIFKSNNKITLKTQNEVRFSLFKYFRIGFVMNVMNPKVGLFFLAFFPGFLFSKEISTVTQFYTLGLIFMLISFVVFALIAFLAGSIGKQIQKNQKVGLYFKWMQIIVFVGIGIFILL